MKTIKSKIATVAFALAGTFTASASHAQDTTPSVVIVHGTFADGSDWAKVVPLLQAQGVAVTVVQNPLTSLADDVAATRRALNNQQGKVVLVGHSWDGTVITEAGSDPKVSALVYVAAFAPEAGQTNGEQGKGAPTPPGTSPAPRKWAETRYRWSTINCAYMASINCASLMPRSCRELPQASTALNRFAASPRRERH